jgi:hypothetical protein
MGILGLFSSKKRESESTQLPVPSAPPMFSVHNRIAAAFTRVKQDISLVSAWVKYLKDKDFMAEERHVKTQRELGEHKVMIDQLRSEIAELKDAQKQVKIGSFPNLVRTKSEPASKGTFEKKIVSMLQIKRKGHVLNKILDLTATEAYSTKDIERVIVEEKGLCGRTAFYDYLRELKNKNMIKQEERGSRKVIVPVKTEI